jgi:hypothetical protein
MGDGRMAETLDLAERGRFGVPGVDGKSRSGERLRSLFVFQFSK